MGQRLNDLLAEAGQQALEPLQMTQFQQYMALLLRWNARVNLTAIRDEEGILSRHFVESIACARALPEVIRSLLDFGSGAGFPGIPIAICRPEISVTLAESQGKKAAFLREAIRVIGIAATVHSGRAETLSSQFDCVTLRAVDRMDLATQGAARLVAPRGWLAVMTTDLAEAGIQAAAGASFSWEVDLSLPGSENRKLILGELAINLPA
jgi:16S rRNA (guanine527-N7)-methyltransferase